MSRLLDIEAAVRVLAWKCEEGGGRRTVLAPSGETAAITVGESFRQVMYVAPCLPSFTTNLADDEWLASCLPKQFSFEQWSKYCDVLELMWRRRRYDQGIKHGKAVNVQLAGDHSRAALKVVGHTPPVAASDAIHVKAEMHDVKIVSDEYKSPHCITLGFDCMKRAEIQGEPVDGAETWIPGPIVGSQEFFDGLEFEIVREGFRWVVKAIWTGKTGELNNPLLASAPHQPPASAIVAIHKLCHCVKEFKEDPSVARVGRLRANASSVFELIVGTVPSESQLAEMLKGL